MRSRCPTAAAPLVLGALLCLGAAGALGTTSGCTSPDPGAPAPGGGGGGSGGEPGCADLSATGSCQAQRPGACRDGEACTLPRSRSCGATRCCTLAFECRPEVGQRPGGYRCDTDDQCAAGVCLAVSGVGLCLRACELTTAGSSCPEGLDCLVVGITGSSSVHACIGSEGGVTDPERALCAHDGDCAEGRYCRITGGNEFWSGTAHGLCVTGSRTGEAGLSCEREQQGLIAYRDEPPEHSDLCPEGGLCAKACDGGDADGCGCVAAAVDGYCRGATCTQPCASDAECPDRFVCRASNVNYVLAPDPDLLFGSCQFPNYFNSDWGCFDETDCCVGATQRSGRECCAKRAGVCQAPPSEVTHCRVELQGSRFLSACREPSGLGALGAACSSPAECESGLCGPDDSCVSPCMEGLRDRCAELLPGSSCCPFPVGEACVPGCRLDCATGPSCP